MTISSVLKRRIGHAFLWLLVCCPFPGVVYAEEAPIIILIQPTLGEKTTRQIYQPLADYLQKETGRRFTILTRPNFFAYWETVHRDIGYELALDDAHFTDYRVQKLGFRVLAKLPGNVSYSLVVSNRVQVRDPLELAGKRIASFVSPSLGATRLNAMFPNPSRRPAMIEIESAIDGVTMLQQGKAEAAMLPTPFVADSVAHGGFTLLTTTEPIPNMALSASSKLNIRLRDKIRTALLSAERSDSGKTMLRQLGIDRFEAATQADYMGYERVLKDLWGY